LEHFKQALDYRVILVFIAASVTFCYANIVLKVEIPQIFGPLYLLDAQGISLQYIALIVGSVIGELLAGPLSDWWMKFCNKKRGGQRVIAGRLWISYYGYSCVIVGLIVFVVYLFKAKQRYWTISH
jgi:MFS family permease